MARGFGLWARCGAGRRGLVASHGGESSGALEWRKLSARRGFEGEGGSVGGFGAAESGGKGGVSELIRAEAVAELFARYASSSRSASAISVSLSTCHEGSSSTNWYAVQAVLEQLSASSSNAAADSNEGGSMGASLLLLFVFDPFVVKGCIRRFSGSWTAGIAVLRALLSRPMTSHCGK